MYVKKPRQQVVITLLIVRMNGNPRMSPVIWDCSTSVGLWDFGPFIRWAGIQISELVCGWFCVWQLQAVGRGI